MKICWNIKKSIKTNVKVTKGEEIMKVGYAILYEDGELVISKNHTILLKKIAINYGEFEDTDVPWKNEIEKIEKVQILDQVKSNCMKAWFIDCLNLITLINFKDLDTSDCTDFSEMFYNCQSLQELNELQNWNVSNGTDFTYMFAYCESLQDLNELQTWDISNGTNFSYMFAFCLSLQDLNELQTWDISNGTEFLDMFYNCKSLEEISLSDTLNILTIEMFELCNPKLKIHWKNHIYTYADLLEYQTIY